MRGRITAGSPFFLVDDVEAIAEWYRDHLGFAIGEYFRESEHHHHEGDEPHHHGDGDIAHAHEHGHSEHGKHQGEAVFVIVSRDAARLMFGKSVEPGLGVRANRLAKEFSSDAYYWVDGIEDFFADVKAAGPPFYFELTPMPYGLLEFAVRDPDGRQVTFGGLPTGE
jgi:uncharacterized glyoxalase superfamily protein PhnB